MARDPKERFTDRVGDYVKHRPDYPGALYELLVREHGLAPEQTVVDLGAGTGLLARLFLERGHRVIGVEPNEAMRSAGDVELARFNGWRSVCASAEDTTLPDASTDVITAGQAFHWFDPVRTKRECIRIAKPRGLVVLVWNTWHQATSSFMRGYASIVERYTSDRFANHHSNPKQLANVARFFGGEFQAESLPHAQRFDREGLRGRLLSSSYAPKPGHPQHEPMIAELDRLFDEHHDGDGAVTFELRTQVFAGRLPA
jgi:SAM-dependent methyltransferase